jgi:hypothetical protein
MSSMSGFTWPHQTNIKRYEPPEPVPASNHRGLIVGLSLAAIPVGIILTYTIFFFALKRRKARAARKTKDVEADVKTIELRHNDPSPYVGDGHQGGDICTSRSARLSSELPVHYSGVRKEDGELDFVEVDLSDEKIRD